MNSSESGQILVLGTKGVGKTTLLTVLGTKFERMCAFGLSMVPDDRETLLFVRRAARGMLVNHSFPAATDRADATTLSWNVLCGTELLFRLSSLDCAGETISEVFGGDAPEAADYPDTGDEMRKARELLSNLAENATTICIVLAPHQLPGNRSASDLSDPATVACMDAVDDLVYAVAHSRRFDGKRLVVALTQTDGTEIREEIVRRGGPRGYIHAKCPALANSIRFEAAHVVAVAPVVVRDGGSDAENCSRAVYVPERFDSIGLEDLLVGLGGAMESPLAPLAESMHTLRRAEWIYNQALRSGGAADRLCAARKRARAANTFAALAMSLADSTEMDAGVREVTKRHIDEAIVSAKVALKVEEAVSKVLTDRRAPAEPSALRDALVSAAVSAARSVPGIPIPDETELYLSSSAWAERERKALPLAKNGLAATLQKAIAEKDRVGAENAYGRILDIETAEKSDQLRALRPIIDKIEYPDQIRPFLCQGFIQKTDGNRIALGAGNLLCQNDSIRFRPKLLSGFSAEINPIMGTPLALIPAILIGCTWPLSLPIIIVAHLSLKKKVALWHCDLKELANVTVKKKLISCCLTITINDGTEIFISKSIKFLSELNSLASALEKLRGAVD